jgi:prepilin-type N-terminal cleavage/methylation domain-containing protein
LPHQARGFTLVEVLVAVVILAIGVLAMAGGSIIVTRDIGLARATAAAGSLAQSKVDQIRTLAAASVPPCGSPLFVGSAAPVQSGASTLSWTITGTGSERVVRVVVDYSWSSRRLSDTLTTVVAC